MEKHQPYNDELRRFQAEAAAVLGVTVQAPPRGAATPPRDG